MNEEEKLAARKKAASERLAVVREKRAKQFADYRAGLGPKPATSRSRLQGNFLQTLAEDFDKYGKRAIERARIQDPMGYVKAIVALMPRQFEQSTPLNDLSDQELAAGIEFLKSRLAISDGKGIEAAQIAQPLKRLQAIHKANGFPPRGDELPRAVIDGGESVGQDVGGGL